ncbi:MAG: XdhC family protein [Bacteroidetes bacterium]|nr:MAG: XdhC family protein [Bacteroidota bacterium]
MKKQESIYKKLTEAELAGKRAALCVITGVRGSTPRSVGAKMIVYEDGNIFGSVGGGDLEKSVIENALKAIQNSKAETFRHDLLHQHSMCCGGSVDIFIEPIQRKNKLYIFGAGHTGHALAQHAVHLDFEVVLIDERREYIDSIHIEDINKLPLHYKEALTLLPFDQHTYICVMTYSHPNDRDILAYCITKPWAYLGMIGSRRKVELTKKMFTAAGIADKELLEKVDMPMGIEIEAETPHEIAISILAKLVNVKRNSISKSPASASSISS